MCNCYYHVLILLQNIQFSLNIYNIIGFMLQNKKQNEGEKSQKLLL